MGFWQPVERWLNERVHVGDDSPLPNLLGWAGRYKTQVTGHRSQVTGHRSQVTGHRAQVTGHRAQGTGHRS